MRVSPHSISCGSLARRSGCSARPATLRRAPACVDSAVGACRTRWIAAQPLLTCRARSSETKIRARTCPTGFRSHRRNATSMTAVLSSMTSRARHASCQATTSMMPRHPRHQASTGQVHCRLTERMFVMMDAHRPPGGQPPSRGGQPPSRRGRPAPSGGRRPPEPCTSGPRSWTSSTLPATTCSDGAA